MYKAWKLIHFAHFKPAFLEMNPQNELIFRVTVSFIALNLLESLNDKRNSFKGLVCSKLCSLRAIISG